MTTRQKFGFRNVSDIFLEMSISFDRAMSCDLDYPLYVCFILYNLKRYIYVLLHTPLSRFLSSLWCQNEYLSFYTDNNYNAKIMMITVLMTVIITIVLLMRWCSINLFNCNESLKFNSWLPLWTINYVLLDVDSIILCKT